MQSRLEPEIGKQYTYDEVGDFFDHDASPLDWVLFRGRYIVALRLREEFNRIFDKSSVQVYVGADSPTKEWGNTLANDTARVPIFVKNFKADKYTYMGIFDVIGDYTSESDCRTAEMRIPFKHNGVSRLVGLRKY